MAQQDATEQVKEVLRQVIKYRFWIAISVAALCATIAYVIGSGPVKKAAADETGKIKSAFDTVKKYASGGPTPQYQPIVEEKTQVVSQDVKTAWKALYDRQAPLLTWPETVQERFRKWGRKWPEGEDPGRVLIAIGDYIMAYPAYVDMVYKTFDPFNYETGEGIVAAAPKEGLLRPAQYQVDRPPDLGAVWAAQERLWIQHTLLDVVAQVNKNANAKNWDSAIIKQIEVLEVGNPLAQDQKSLANSEALEKAPGIYAPGQEPQAEDTGGGGGMDGAGGPMAGMGMMQMMGGRKGGEMSGMGMGMGGGGASGGGSQYDDSIYFITPANEQSKEQFKILPVLMTVLLDQDHVQDFLVGLENSPMSIEVRDIELQRPTARVTKPEKGTQLAGFGYGGMMGMMGMPGGMGEMMMQRRMMGGGMGGGMTGYAGMMGQMMSQQRMMQRGMDRPGMMGGGGSTQAQRKGQDVRSKDRAKEREAAEKEAAAVKGPSLFDPYFDIVEVTVYGRARFFNRPPEEPQPEPSPGEAPATPTAESAPPATPAAQPTPAPAPGSPAPAPGPQEKPGAAQPGSTAPASSPSPNPNPGDHAAQPAEAAKAAVEPAPAAPAAKAESPPNPAQDQNPVPKK